jgi:hypothetical protein
VKNPGANRSHLAEADSELPGPKCVEFMFGNNMIWKNILSTALAVCAIGASLLSAPAETATAYLFTSFRGNGDGLHLAWSTNGLRWADLNRIFLKPTVGGQLLRDPHILHGPDGLFHMVWTTGWRDNGIGYASSSNLVDWSEQKFLPVMGDVPGTENCWAPETIYDVQQRQYVITWSSDVKGRFPATVSTNRMNNRTYYVVTKDFVSFSKPEVLLDPGFDHIDTTILARDGKFIAVFKEGDMQAKGVNGPIHFATSDNLLGPYGLNPKPIVTKRAEGPTLIEVDGKTLLYADFYSNGHYGAYETIDWKTWRDVSASVAVVNGQRHGTIFAVPQVIVENIRQAEAEALAAVPKPILDGFTADPAIRVFGDTYYVYPTSDKPNWNTTDFSVWSSKNLVDWKKEGMILDVTKDLKWADLQAWAPDCVERNGTYYFYFCARGKIGVATAKSPTGPFVDAIGKPLLVKEKDGKIKTNTIDPYPFIDDDGQAYLYWGNGNNFGQVYKLKPDMITLDGDPVEIAMKQFREGIVVFKRNGKYYFMWSIDDARSPDYRVGWGTADSPLGPVKAAEKNFIVLRRNGLAQGTAHHSVVQVPGTDRWYVAYHRHAIPNGSGYQRETCLARMEFDADGNIKPMDPMIPAFKVGDKGEPISAR